MNYSIVFTVTGVAENVDRWFLQNVPHLTPAKILRDSHGIKTLEFELSNPRDQDKIYNLRPTSGVSVTWRTNYGLLGPIVILAGLALLVLK